MCIRDRLPSGAYANEAIDNNFVRASERSFVSERFYLYATSDVFDNTKDIGLSLIHI